MAHIAEKLAAEFVASKGWVCILIAPHDLSRQCLVTIDGVAAREDPGHRVWLLRKHADKVMASFFSRCEHAKRRPRGSGLQVALPVTAVAQLIRGIADGFGIEVADDVFINEQLVLVTTRIDAQMSRITKGLAREYKTSRTSGASLPKYDLWLIDRLRPAFALGLG